MHKFYCGLDTFPKWLKRILSFGVNEACMIHDMNYINKNRCRFVSDLIFFFDMLKISLVNILKGIYGIIVAPIFFISVVIFGIISWRKS